MSLHAPRPLPGAVFPPFREQDGSTGPFVTLDPGLDPFSGSQPPRTASMPLPASTPQWQQQLQQQKPVFVSEHPSNQFQASYSAYSSFPNLMQQLPQQYQHFVQQYAPPQHYAQYPAQCFYPQQLFGQPFLMGHFNQPVYFANGSLPQQQPPLCQPQPQPQPLLQQNPPQMPQMPPMCSAPPGFQNTSFGQPLEQQPVPTPPAAPASDDASLASPPPALPMPSIGAHDSTRSMCCADFEYKNSGISSTVKPLAFGTGDSEIDWLFEIRQAPLDSSRVQLVHFFERAYEVNVFEKKPNFARLENEEMEGFLNKCSKGWAGLSSLVMTAVT